MKKSNPIYFNTVTLWYFVCLLIIWRCEGSGDSGSSILDGNFWDVHNNLMRVNYRCNETYLKEWESICSRTPHRFCSKYHKRVPPPDSQVLWLGNSHLKELFEASLLLKHEGERSPIDSVLMGNFSKTNHSKKVCL